MNHLINFSELGKEAFNNSYIITSQNNYFELIRKNCESYSASVLLSFIILLALNIILIFVNIKYPEFIQHNIFNILYLNVAIVLIIVIQMVV